MSASAARVVEVLRAGALTTVQDRGRIGLAHLGVPRAGALDAPAADLANRLVGNDVSAAVLEVTLGGFAMRADAGLWVAVTGAGRQHARAEWLAAGATLEVSPPGEGVRTYVAVAGGVDVDPVLGSRSTDTLAWVGPPRVADGDLLPVGRVTGEPRGLDVPRPPARGPLRLHPGPHGRHFEPHALEALCAATYAVRSASNRVGLRLDGPAVRRTGDAELESEGMVLGAVQVPPDGQPVVLLADHPTTGGYPVVAVVDAADLWQCAQLRPGEDVWFTPARAVA
jgi:biotin-dependent carboxylase-like uncharacterized protein